MRGKGLEVLNMDGVLPVTHLELEETHAAADDVEWTVVQWCEVGDVGFEANQHALRVA